MLIIMRNNARISRCLYESAVSHNLPDYIQLQYDLRIVTMLGTGVVERLVSLWRSKMHSDMNIWGGGG